MKGSIVVSVAALLLVGAHAYRPVLIMHGILDAASTMDVLADHVRKAHPGTYVKSLDVANYVASVDGMWKQVADLSNAIEKEISDNEELFRDGFHVMGFSQGGVLLRGYLETVRHNVRSFVALSSPLAGQFGDTYYMNWLFPNKLPIELYRVLYSEEAMNHVSVAGYWRDPMHHDMYLEKNDFLTVLNNENAFNETLKENFCRLHKLVMLGSPNDGVITPWESAHFGQYEDDPDANSTSELPVLAMQNTTLYQDDLFGLRTLDESGRIHTVTLTDVNHHRWYKDSAIFETYIAPHLD